MSAAATLQRLFNTLKYVKIRQLLFYVIRRKFPTKVVAPRVVPALNPNFRLAAPIPVDGAIDAPLTFRFLNVARRFESVDAISWAPPDVPRLWRYNLHYFDYLRQPSPDTSLLRQIMRGWIDNNPQGSAPGWEPFTCSLRIVNWIFFLHGRAMMDGDPQTSVCYRSLYTQALWLEKNDEKHLLANHYFENLKALAFAGCWFSGDDARRWLRKAIVGLRGQLQEQNLPDGGHYERSPQYHALMLENYFDLYNLAINNRDRFSSDFIELLSAVCRNALTWLRDVVFPDESIPLFNDSAFSIAPALHDLEQYAQRLFGVEVVATWPVPSRGAFIISKPDSGLYGYRSGADMFIIDCGEIGPSYQPGHTHCDFLSYELMLGNRRIIVDTGVCEYEPGAMRHYVRSTAAHNTISVDGDEQSEIWGEFRVARRAKKISASIEQREHEIVFRGAYRGFHRSAARITHHRQVTIQLSSAAPDCIVIADRVEGRGVHRIDNFVHFHPDVALRDEGGGTFGIYSGGDLVARIAIPEGIECCLKETIYCPEFGLKIPNPCLVMTKNSLLPCDMSYRITKY